MERLVDVIENNSKLINRLLRAKRIPLSLIADYDIYIFYKAITYENAQMKRYMIVAKKFKCSVDTVRRAVISMEKVI